MRSKRMRVLVTGVAAVAIGIYAETGLSGEKSPTRNDPVTIAVDKGVKWLVSVQGKDGGWGQDGGETSYVRQGERLESNGNDVANTAVAAEALLHTGTTPTTGEYRDSLRARRRVHPAARRAEPRRGPRRHRSAGHADPAQAGTLHRYVPHFQTAGRTRRQHGRRAGQRARPAQPAEVRRQDRKEPAQGRKLEHRRRLGADSGNLDGVAEPVHRQEQGGAGKPDGDGEGAGLYGQTSGSLPRPHRAQVYRQAPAAVWAGAPAAVSARVRVAVSVAAFRSEDALPPRRGLRGIRRCAPL